MLLGFSLICIHHEISVHVFDQQFTYPFRRSTLRLYIGIENMDTKRNYFRIIMPVDYQISIFSPCKYSHVTFFPAVFIYNHSYQSSLAYLAESRSAFEKFDMIWKILFTLVSVIKYCILEKNWTYMYYKKLYLFPPIHYFFLQNLFLRKSLL